MKKFSIYFLVLALVLGMMVPVQAQSGKLVIYSTVYDDEYNMIVDAFTAKYPDISIELVQGGAGDLKTRLQAEAANPQADVMFGGLLYTDYLNHLNEDGSHQFLAKYVSPNDETMPEAFRNTTGFLTWTTIQISNLFIDVPALEKLGIQVNGYKDLLQPELKGKIIMADPTSSSSAWNHLVTMLTVFGDGDYNSQQAWDYVEALIQNLNGVISSSSSLTYKGVATGEYPVGITYEAPLYSSYIAEGFDNLKVIYMEEGTCATPFASAMVQGAPNPENAQKFIDFVCSEEAQKLWANSTARQANTNLPTTNEWLPSASEFLLKTADLQVVAEKQEEIKVKWASLWAKHN